MNAHSLLFRSVHQFVDSLRLGRPVSISIRVSGAAEPLILPISAEAIAEAEQAAADELAASVEWEPNQLQRMILARLAKGPATSLVLEDELGRIHARVGGIRELSDRGLVRTAQPREAPAGYRLTEAGQQLAGEKRTKG